jgi:hypothetical protein
MTIAVSWNARRVSWQMMMMMMEAAFSEHRYASNRLHGIISRKTVIFLVTHMRVTNLSSNYSAVISTLESVTSHWDIQNLSKPKDSFIMVFALAAYKLKENLLTRQLKTEILLIYI